MDEWCVQSARNSCSFFEILFVHKNVKRLLFSLCCIQKQKSLSCSDKQQPISSFFTGDVWDGGEACDVCTCDERAWFGKVARKETPADGIKQHSSAFPNSPPK